MLQKCLRSTALPLLLAFGAGTPLFLAEAPAHAQDASATSAQAKDKYEAGKKSYRLGDFDDAITQWKAGYQIKDDPVFLFNIAQAYREKSDFQKAIFFYESYLKEAKDPSNRGQVETRVAELKKLLAAQTSQSKAPPTEPIELDKKPDPVVTKPVEVATNTNNNTKPPETTPDTTVHTDPAKTPDSTPAVEGSTSHPGRGMKIAGLVTGGVGVALLATGVVFALGASSAQSDVNAAVAAHQPWDSNLQSKDSTGRSDSTISMVAFGVGAAAIVGGGVLYYLGIRKDHQAAMTEQSFLIMPSVTPTSAGLFVNVRY